MWPFNKAKKTEWKLYQFVPKQDITAYEVAKLLSRTILKELAIDENSDEKPDAAMRRHFTTSP